MKIVKAIPPYIYKGASNFKYYPCEAWEKIGGKVSGNFYPPQFLHSLIYRINFAFYL